MREIVVFGREIFKATLIVSIMTMLSRILGFVRDMLIARLFGVDAATDAFFVAFKIPNFLRRLFTEGAFARAFIPVLWLALCNYSHPPFPRSSARRYTQVSVNLLNRVRRIPGNGAV
ncbi:lipid II flippase MurJ [Methylotuvimicrobium sp. KM1]|uniref:lipid II flippase MurJ n=1 Tax=Methylotuvimicrobium sp. KM1 TaxID=3377707 RepID=UPI00384FCA33